MMGGCLKGGGGAGGGRRQDPHLFDSTVQIQICDNNLIECMKTETEEAQKEDLPSVTYMNISLSHQQPDAYRTLQNFYTVNIY